MGARRPFFMSTQHDKEKELYREVSRTVSTALPGVEVLALELTGKERFCVYVDQPGGVDHALCERVTGVLRPYLDRYSVEVSSPGIERPLTKPEHFQRFRGQRVRVRTREALDGRRNFTGTIADADDEAVSVELAEGSVTIPLERIRRSNLVPDGSEAPK